MQSVSTVLVDLSPQPCLWISGKVSCDLSGVPQGALDTQVNNTGPLRRKMGPQLRKLFQPCQSILRRS